MAAQTPGARVRALTNRVARPGAHAPEELRLALLEYRELLGNPTSEGAAALAEAVAGPPGLPERSALRWFTATLQRGIPSGLSAMEREIHGLVLGGTLQVLSTAAAADTNPNPAEPLGSSTRGRHLIKQPWKPDQWTPTGILPPLLRLARNRKEVDAQNRGRALRVAVALSTDPVAAVELVKAGWKAHAAKAIAEEPDADVVEGWHALMEMLQGVAAPQAEEKQNATKEKAKPAAEPELVKMHSWAGERAVRDDDLLPEDDIAWTGQMVRVVGLRAKPQYNGLLGHAVSANADTGRVEVCLTMFACPNENDRPNLNVKRENLTIVGCYKQRGTGRVAYTKEDDSFGLGDELVSQICEAPPELPLDALGPRLLRRAGGQIAISEETAAVFEAISAAQATDDPDQALELAEHAVRGGEHEFGPLSLTRLYLAYSAYGMAHLLLASEAGGGDPDGTVLASAAESHPEAFGRMMTHCRAVHAIVKGLLDVRVEDGHASHVFRLAPEDERTLTMLVMGKQDVWSMLAAPVIVAVANNVGLKLLGGGGPLPPPAGSSREFAWELVGLAMRVIDLQEDLKALAVHADRPGVPVPLVDGTRRHYYGTRAVFLGAYHKTLQEYFMPPSSKHDEGMRILATNPLVYSFMNDGYQHMIKNFGAELDETLDSSLRTNQTLMQRTRAAVRSRRDAAFAGSGVAELPPLPTGLEAVPWDAAVAALEPSGGVTTLFCPVCFESLRDARDGVVVRMGGAACRCAFCSDCIRQWVAERGSGDDLVCLVCRRSERRT